MQRFYRKKKQICYFPETFWKKSMKLRQLSPVEIKKFKLKLTTDDILYPILNERKISIVTRRQINAKTVQFRFYGDLKGNGNYKWKTYECDAFLANVIDKLFKAKKLLGSKRKPLVAKKEKELHQIVDDFISEFFDNNWSYSKGPYHEIVRYNSKNVQAAIEKKLVPTPIKNMYDKIQNVKQHKSANSIETALKEIASSALFEAQKKDKNFFGEQYFFEKVADFINYEATFAEILKKINETTFVFSNNIISNTFSNKPILLTNKDKGKPDKKVTPAIYDIYQICADNTLLSNGQPVPKDRASKLFYILNLAKHKTEEPGIFHLFRNKATTHEFYKTIGQCIVLKKNAVLREIVLDINDPDRAQDRIKKEKLRPEEKDKKGHLIYARKK